MPQAWPSAEGLSGGGAARHEPETIFPSRSSHPGSLDRAIRNINSLIRVAVQNVIPSIGAFGIGCEKLLIPRWWNTPITINVARVEFQIKLLPIPVVCDRDQHLRLHGYPVHALRSYPIFPA